MLLLPLLIYTILYTIYYILYYYMYIYTCVVWQIRICIEKSIAGKETCFGHCEIDILTKSNTEIFLSQAQSNLIVIVTMILIVMVVMLIQMSYVTLTYWPAMLVNRGCLCVL